MQLDLRQTLRATFGNKLLNLALAAGERGRASLARDALFDRMLSRPMDAQRLTALSVPSCSRISPLGIELCVVSI